MRKCRKKLAEHVARSLRKNVRKNKNCAKMSRTKISETNVKLKRTCLRQCFEKKRKVLRKRDENIVDALVKWGENGAVNIKQ